MINAPSTRKIKTLLLTAFLIFASLFLLESMTNKIKVRVGRNWIEDNNPPDFLMYYTGAKIIKDEGIKKLYDWDAQVETQSELAGLEKMKGILAFRAPPITGLLVRPLAEMSYTEAFYPLALVNIILVVLILAVYYKMVTVDKKIWFYLLLALPWYIPIWSNVSAGQISLLILLIISLTYYFIKNRRMLLAGLVVGFVLLKPQFLIIIPMLVVLFSKDKKVKSLLIGIVSSLAVLVVLNIGLYGIGFLTTYPKFLFLSESVSYGTNVLLNYNLSSSLSLLISNSTYLKVTTVIVNLLLYGAVLLTLAKKNEYINKDLAFAAIVFFTPLINLHTMPVDIVVFLLPLYLVSSDFYRKSDNRRLYSFLILMFLLSWSGFLYLQFGTTLVYLILAFWILKLAVKKANVH